LRWIDQKPDEPFFAFLNYYDVHVPYIPPQPYRSRFSQLEKPGGLISTDWDQDHIYVPMTSEQLQGEIDAYDGVIAYVDDQIDQLLAEFGRRELADTTLVIITSDHGESFGEHGLLEHNNSLYREVIHVPLIFSWTEHIPAGIRIKRPMSNVAGSATLLDLLGEPKQTVFPGPSLARLWEEPDRARDWPDPLAEVAQIPWVPDQHLPAHGAMRSVLTSQWHYIVHDEFGEELYEWQADPEESTDLAKEQEYRSVLEGFRIFFEGLLAAVQSLSKLCFQ
jgi:arylsulfatase A-like enzyme